ncbi:MAG TPA: ATP-binding protein [Candidatus Acidoferrales bacterium]|nr:ATP-binding protein [Candidatus Acidoferrales bacterium]
MRARLFWNLGLAYFALLLAALLAVDFYSSRSFAQVNLHAADNELSSLLNIAQTRPPLIADPAALTGWTRWMAQSGARVTIIDRSGRVLAESAPDPDGVGNNSSRPEVQEAFASGSGRSVRRSAALNRDVVYHAERYQPSSGPPVVIRMALPLDPMDSSLAALRRKLLAASLVILIIGVIASFLFVRSFTRRVERLKAFSFRLTEGDFRLLEAEDSRDELADLAQALNQTAKWMEGTIRSLSGERNRSSAILRSMVEGVAVIDAQERLVFSNRAFSGILNLDSSSTEGRPLIEVVRHSDLLGLMRRALQGEEGLQGDITTGIVQQRTFSVTAAPVKALEPVSAAAPSELQPRPQTPEKPAGAVVVLHDVTELRRLERVRQDFVANVSHEFKTPLTAIQGFAETLLAGALDDPRHNRRFLGIIRDHAARLARLTDDLLKLARIEAGKLEVQFYPVSVVTVIERCTETALLKSSQKQISIEIDVPPGLPPVRADSSLLRDVLQNLLDNAIQYTQAGGRILVTAALGEREVVIAVTDTGIGIPLADQERIFERFYRVDAGRSREVGGTGLGLSIAKHIVEVHGGRLWVESEVGLGSKFSFSIPLAA